jgi:hypothetical protein
LLVGGLLADWLVWQDFFLLFFAIAAVTIFIARLLVALMLLSCCHCPYN